MHVRSIILGAAALLVGASSALAASAGASFGMTAHVTAAAGSDECRNNPGPYISLAGEIAANGPLAVRAAKRMMRHAMSEDFEDHVQRQYLALLPLFGTKDFREGIAAFMEKRDADFTGE